ncbi:TetR family transcriptional regulator [Sphingorhabdus sp. Alg231-15]|uniref:TetR family transcriptional regulator n=1 Tax=Sphingorhabdus sp. Alg231-15 TaxID=1922222 RepID=UPI000D55B34B
MAKQEDRKRRTREKMISAASRNFRQSGYNGVGVDTIARDAEVTSGAFYAHLKSKDAAFEIAVNVGLDEVIAAIPKYQSEHGKDWVRAFADYYLGKPHRDDLACGCAMTTLSPDVVRTNDHIRKSYENRMSVISGLIAQGLSGKNDEQRQEKAWMLLSILIGGLTLARAVKSKKLASGISASAKTAALALVS